MQYMCVTACALFGLHVHVHVLLPQSRQVSLPTHLEIGQVPVHTTAQSTTTSTQNTSANVMSGGGKERAVMAVAPVISLPTTVASNGVLS